MDSKYAHMKGGMMLERSYDPSFPLRLALKDARLILDAADGKRWNHHASTTRRGLADRARQPFAVVIVLVKPVAVRGFAQ